MKKQIMDAVSLLGTYGPIMVINKAIRENINKDPVNYKQAEERTVVDPTFIFYFLFQQSK
jgi:hypothetical protein